MPKLLQFTGTEWIEIKGVKGDAGRSIVGPEGKIGPIGPSGPPGPFGPPGKDGVDAILDVVGFSAEILSQVENRLPLIGERIRDGLELLKEEDRLDVSAIKGLTEMLKELRSMAGRRIVGGVGPNFNATKVIESEVVSGSGTTFTLLYTPLSGVKVYAVGQRLTPGAQKDYTISNKTITTSQSWTAGDILADYIKL